MPVTGVDVIKQNLARIQKAVSEALQEEITDIAEEILSDSRDICPQLTGALIASADIDEEDSLLFGVFKRSIFYDTPYAIKQHEGDFNPGPITRQKPGAGRKYLQRAFDAKKRQAVARIGRRTEQTLRLVLR